MGNFSDWLEAKSNETPSKEGVRPKTEKEVEKFKHADLIVLPESVQGTNCGNCKYADETMFCRHHDIKTQVTKRNCCKYWDNKDVKRDWKMES